MYVHVRLCVCPIPLGLSLAFYHVLRTRLGGCPVLHKVVKRGKERMMLNYCVWAENLSLLQNTIFFLRLTVDLALIN